MSCPRAEHNRYNKSHILREAHNHILLEQEQTLYRVALCDAVQAAIDKRLPKACSSEACILIEEAHFSSMLRPHLLDCIFPAITRALEEMVKSSNNVIRDYAKIIQRQLDELRQ